MVAKWETQSGTRDGKRDVKGVEIASGNSWHTASQVDQKPSVDIDLRAQGVAQDAILQDEAKMQEIDQQVNKVKAGPNKISIRNESAKVGVLFIQ